MSTPLGTGQSLFHPPSPSLPGAQLPLPPPPVDADASGNAMREAAFLARNARDPSALRASSNPPVDDEGNTATADRPYEFADEDFDAEEDDEEDEYSLSSLPAPQYSVPRTARRSQNTPPPPPHQSHPSLPNKRSSSLSSPR